MKLFFNLIFAIYSIFYLGTLLFRGKLHRRFLERFGVFDHSKLEKFASGVNKGVWLHAVSVGEVAAARPLVEALRSEFPEWHIVISTTTRAGNHLARHIFHAGLVHRAVNSPTVIYFPIDFSFITRRVVDLIRPKVFLLTETEIWPNLILSLFEANVPIVMVNGRISDRSYGLYRAIAPVMRPVLDRISVFCMQSDTDARRIRDIGAAPEKVTVTGNLKFDATISAPSAVSKKQAITREYLGISPDEKLIIAGSTHKGEEKVVLRVYRQLRKKDPGVRLLIAPRYVERVRLVESAIRHRGLKAVRVSRIQYYTAKERAAMSSSSLLLLDLVGHLRDIFSLATVVFMGGSMIKKGGHNLVEPAIHAKPIVFGPHMFNFRDMAEEFLKNKAALKVEGERDLTEILGRLLDNPAEREELGRNAKKLVEENSGATLRTVEVIKGVLRD